MFYVRLIVTTKQKPIADKQKTKRKKWKHPTPKNSWIAAKAALKRKS